VSEVGTFFANRGREEKDKTDEAKKKDEEADRAERSGDTDRAATLRAEAVTLRADAKRLSDTYSNGSPVRILATALTGAAGSNVTGSLGSLAQGAAVNVLQSLAVTEIKQLVNGIKGDDATKETVRAALQAVVGCAGAAASGSGSCGSAAVGAAASVVLVNILTARDRPVDSNGDGIVDGKNLAEQQALTNIITTIIAGVAAGAGIDVPAATVAAQIEAENNGVCDSSKIDCRITVAQIRAREGRTLSELRSSGAAGNAEDQERYNNYIEEFGSEERANAFLAGRDELALLADGVVKGTATPEEQRRYLALLRAAGGDITTAQNIAGLELYYSNPANVFTLESNPNFANARFIDIGRFLLNFGSGTATGVANSVGEAAQGLEEILRDPAAAFEKTKEAIRFIIANPGEFADIVVGQGLNYVSEVRSASILLEAGLISGDVNAQTRAGQRLGELVGAPIASFLLTAGVGTTLKGLQFGGRIINIVDTVRRGPDANAPNAPNPPNTPDRPRPDPERDGGGNGNGDRTNPPDTNDNPNPNNADGGGNGNGDRTNPPDTNDNDGNPNPNNTDGADQSDRPDTNASNNGFGPPRPGLEIPQGFTARTFDRLSSTLRAAIEGRGLGSDIFLMGSRSGGTALPDADFDFAVRVSPDRFDELGRVDEFDQA
jgi:hypothetical protein